MKLKKISKNINARMNWLTKFCSGACMLFIFFGCVNPFRLTAIVTETSTSSFQPPPDAPTLPTPLVVEKVYPIAGASWMQYISGSSGSTPFNRNDVACAGNEAGSMTACIHGGDKLKVTLDEFTTCDQLRMTDTLEVFTWNCFVVAGKATFYSTGFNENKGLNDLIDFTNSDWKPLSVSLYEGGLLRQQSSSLKWWSNISNPIVALPDSSVSTQTISGFSAGTILVLTANQISRGYILDQDSIGIVTKADATLSLNPATAQNCNYNTGEAAAPNGAALLCIGSQKYLWIEGLMNDPGHISDIFFTIIDTKFSSFNKLLSYE